MKKLKVTVGELYNIEQSILAADVMKMMFSRKGSLCLLRNMKKMESELEEFKSKRTELIKEYSNGNDSISPESERWGEFVTPYNELASVEVSVEINTIAIDDLPEQITPVVCGLLECMINDSEEEKED